MRLFSVVFILFAIPTFVYSATINIPIDFPTIQQGINAAKGQDTVLVAPGSYVECIDFIGKAITVKSLGGASVTTIDGNFCRSVVSFKNGEGPGSVLSGFTIMNGKAMNGAGVFCFNSSPRISHCILKNNKASYWGGGIFAYQSAPDIRSNVIINNSGFYGGGIGCTKGSNPIILDNIIKNNVASNGGGIFCSDSTTAYISNNKILKNRVFFASAGTSGGGISFRDSDPYILNNLFSENDANAGVGGGISCYNAKSGAVTGNVFSENLGGFGGAIAWTCNPSTFKMENNTFFNNKSIYDGGGISFYNASVLLINNTFYSNIADRYGGGMGICEGSSIVFENVIMWGDAAISLGDEIAITDEGGIFGPSDIWLSNSDVAGGQSKIEIDIYSPGATVNWGYGMIDSDPHFADPLNGDLHLTFSSPCKDTGNNKAVTKFYDFEGDPRIANGLVDMGADEFYTHLYYTGDATPGSNIDLKFIDTPNTSPVILWLGSGVLNSPIHLNKYGDWYLQFPILMEIPLGAIPTPDGVLQFTGTIPVGLTTPLELNLQAVIGSRLTNLCVIEVN